MSPKSKKLKLSDPLDPTTDVGTLIEKAAQRVENSITEAAQAGARLLTGGTRHGAQIEPTVLADVTATIKVVCDEVNTPVCRPYRPSLTARRRRRCSGRAKADDRSEHLVAHDLHGAVTSASTVGSIWRRGGSAGEKPGAGLCRLPDPIFHPLGSLLVDQGADVGGGIQRIAELHRA